MKNLRKRWVIWLVLGLVLVCLVSQLSRCKLPVTNPPPGKIAFVSDGHIYVMESDGSNKVPLTGELEWAISPVWSPDGRHIAFTGVEDNKQGLWVMDADGSNKVHLFNSQYDTYPRWSSAGTHILFQHTQVGSLEVGQYNNLYVADRGDSSLALLTGSLELGGERAAWAPDGTHIAFESMQNSNWEIYVIDRDGSNLVNLSDHPADDEGFVWSPDGTRIAFDVQV
jgi:TolB protein